MEIADDDVLIRRLAPDHVTAGLVNSLAFSGKTHEPYEISVDLDRLTTDARMLTTRPGFGLGTLLAGDARALGLRVVHDPIEGNDAHCLMIGQYSKAVARGLARITRIRRLPDPSPPVTTIRARS
jgi:hypothetical protein